MIQFSINNTTYNTNAQNVNPQLISTGNKWWWSRLARKTFFIRQKKLESSGVPAKSPLLSRPIKSSSNALQFHSISPANNPTQIYQPQLCESQGKFERQGSDCRR